MNQVVKQRELVESKPEFVNPPEASDEEDLPISTTNEAEEELPGASSKDESEESSKVVSITTDLPEDSDEEGLPVAKYL